MTDNNETLTDNIRTTTRNLDKMFEDDRFKRYGNGGRKYFAVVDGGRRVGVVLATRSESYGSYALNKTELDALLRAKTDNRLDEAYIVAVRTNSGGPPLYVDQIDATELSAKLANEVPRSGRYGQFYTLLPGSGFPAVIDDDAPF